MRNSEHDKKPRAQRAEMSAEPQNSRGEEEALDG